MSIIVRTSWSELQVLCNAAMAWASTKDGWTQRRVLSIIRSLENQHIGIKETQGPLAVRQEESSEPYPVMKI